MPNEVKVSRKLFISCILILCIIFIGIIVAQHSYYENKIKEMQNSQGGELTIVDKDDSGLGNVKVK